MKSTKDWRYCFDLGGLLIKQKLKATAFVQAIRLYQIALLFSQLMEKRYLKKLGTIVMVSSWWVNWFQTLAGQKLGNELIIWAMSKKKSTWNYVSTTKFWPKWSLQVDCSPAGDILQRSGAIGERDSDSFFGQVTSCCQICKISFDNRRSGIK